MPILDSIIFSTLSSFHVTKLRFGLRVQNYDLLLYVDNVVDEYS